jgi:hypothetical protein
VIPPDRAAGPKPAREPRTLERLSSWPFQFVPWRVACPAILVLLFLAGHLPFLPASLEDLDSINFALGVRHFDVAHHQPHPPGYPLFILAARVANVVVGPEAKALSLVGIVAGALGAWALVALFRAFRRADHAAWPCAAALVAVTSPLYWFTASRPLSDMAGLAAALGVQALTLAAPSSPLSQLTPLSPERLLRLEGITRATLIASSFLAGLATGIRSQVAWLTVPLIVLTIARWRPDDRSRTAAGAVAAYILGGLIWGVPLVALTGGPSAYWHALFSQGAEDLTGITMLWTKPTPRQLALALYYAFIAPWAAWPCATAVLIFAAIGAARMRRVARSALWTLAAAFVPYLCFDLVFQETITTRYALPLVVPIAYLAVRGLASIPRGAALTLGAGLVGVNLALAASHVWWYSRVEAPAFRLIGDMRVSTRNLARTPLRAPVLAMHRREELDLRRPIQWVSGGMPQISAHLPAPPKHEWLELVKYWNGGGRAPVWFVADPLRSDLALVDHRRPHGSYFWPLRFPVLVGGIRPNTMEWYTLDLPGWYLGEGWALTPETAGVAQEDGRGPGIAPIQGWVRRRADAAVMMIGGRNMTPAPSRLRLEIDGRLVDERDVAPGFFLQMLDLPPGALAGSGEYAAMTLAAGSNRLAIEQFDVQSRGSVMFGFGDGWYEPEYNPSTGSAWRWTSDRATLNVRAGGHPLMLRVRGETELFATTSHVIIRTGDRILAREAIGSTMSLSIGIPSDMVGGAETRITIETDRIHVPAERSWRSRDRRRLGLRVYECRVTPVS